MDKALLAAFRENETKGFTPAEKCLFSLLGGAIVGHKLATTLPRLEAQVLPTILNDLADEVAARYKAEFNTDNAKVRQALSNSIDFVANQEPQ